MPNEQMQSGAWQSAQTTAGLSASRNGPQGLGGHVPNPARPGHSGQLNPGGEEWAQHPAANADALDLV